MSETTCGWVGVIAFIFTLICAFAVAEQRDELKAEAVKRGYAEWIVVSQDKTEFKWKEK